MHKDRLQDGYLIQIGDEKSLELAALAAPPHFDSNLTIMGWHFRNADNTGPNEAGPKNVNVPSDIRKFPFYTSEKDAKQANTYIAYIRSHHPGDARREELVRLLQQISKGYGTLIIKKKKLEDTVPGKRARLTQMDFDVSLTWP